MRTIALDSQILNTVQACGRKTKLEFIDNWRPTEKAEALEKGDMMHRMLAHYYRSKKDGRKDMDNVIKESVSIGRKASTEMDLTDTTVEENIYQFNCYVLFYDRDGWRPIEVERPFSKVLYRREDEVEWRKGDILCPVGTPGAEKITKKEGLQILYEGVIDLVAETPHGIFTVDHKTASRRSTPTKLSNQFMGYCWAVNSLNFIVNKIGFQKTLGEAERFNRHILSYSPQLIDEWQQNAIYWAKMLVGYIDTGFFPPNFTSCDKYAGCIYQQVCETIPEVREFKLQSFYYVGEPWSPHTRDKTGDE